MLHEQPQAQVEQDSTDHLGERAELLAVCDGAAEEGKKRSFVKGSCLGASKCDGRTKRKALRNTSVFASESPHRYGATRAAVLQGHPHPEICAMRSMSLAAGRRQSDCSSSLRLPSGSIRCQETPAKQATARIETPFDPSPRKLCRSLADLAPTAASLLLVRAGLGIKMALGWLWSDCNTLTRFISPCISAAKVGTRYILNVFNKFVSVIANMTTSLSLEEAHDITKRPATYLGRFHALEGPEVFAGLPELLWR